MLMHITIHDSFCSGFTGHEHLYNFGLINMYDPEFATFLPPDNYVQDPTSQQSFNRYAYCMYNPLKYVDPSGELYFGWNGNSSYDYEQAERLVLSIRYNQYLEIMQPTWDRINYFSNSLWSQGDSYGGAIGGNGCHGGGSGNQGSGNGGGNNQNVSTGNEQGDGDPTSTTNSNDTQDGDPQRLVSPNYLWIKCHFWYLYCNRQDMHVDATKINFDFLSFDDLTPKGDGNYSVNLYDYISDCPQLAAALGEITLIPSDNVDYYKIGFDTYDFDLHPNSNEEWFTKRNAATLLGGLWFYGVIDNYQVFPSPSMFFGGGFDIYFDGEVYIKKP